MPINLSEAAAEAVKRIIKENSLPEDKTRLRVGVKGGGCSGFSYMLDLTEDEPGEMDESLESHGVKIVCDMKSYLYLNGVAVDDEQATRIGFETVSTSVGPYIGTGYRHDGNKDKGKQTAKFVPDIPAAGKYDVRIAYTANPNRATNVPVTVNHADGSKTVKVDQRKKPPISELFVSVGTYRFEKGKAGSVLIANDDTDGFVIIDAVQFVPVKE